MISTIDIKSLKKYSPFCCPKFLPQRNTCKPVYGHWFLSFRFFQSVSDVFSMNGVLCLVIAVGGKNIKIVHDL